MPKTWDNVVPDEVHLCVFLETFSALVVWQNQERVHSAQDLGQHEIQLLEDVQPLDGFLRIVLDH